MTFSISKTYSFDAAHELPDHEGKCRNLHGHTYSLTVTLAGTELHEGDAQRGMLLDYGRLDEVVAPLVASLDHRMLNKIVGFEYPTAELIAQRIYYDLRRVMPSGLLLRITVFETPKTSASYGDTI